MAQYSYAQLEGLWINNGGDPAQAPLMAAIALAESSGNSTARNPSGATGLWQILVPVHGDLIKKYGDPTDPNANAKEAVAIYKQQGLKAWTTYTSGAYKQYMKSGVQPVDVAPGTNGGTTTPTSDSSSCCAIGTGGIAGIGGFCLVSKTQLNSLFGIVIISGGMVVGFVGVAWILIYGLKKTGIANVASSLPGPVGTAAKVVGNIGTSRTFSKVS